MIPRFFVDRPIFATVVLTDEINRASPKTQSALLEVMDLAKRFPVKTPQGKGLLHAALNPLRQAEVLARAVPGLARAVGGLAKRDFMPRALDANALAFMRAIKAQFDPDGILNPGKLLP